jgi:hypothetical protein
LAVTFCSWNPVIVWRGVDRFVDRITYATSSCQQTEGIASPNDHQ